MDRNSHNSHINNRSRILSSCHIRSSLRRSRRIIRKTSLTSNSSHRLIRSSSLTPSSSRHSPDRTVLSRHDQGFRRF
jgi:hypothetical protein